jgi:hypothetical protein
MWTEKNCKNRFSLERELLPIKFIGCPFFIEEHVYYECVNGSHRKSKDNDINLIALLIRFYSKIIDTQKHYLTYIFYYII